MANETKKYRVKDRVRFGGKDREVGEVIELSEGLAADAVKVGALEPVEDAAPAKKSGKKSDDNSGEGK